MLRSPSSMLTLALGLVPGCAFEDGDPWGRAEVSMQARFAPEDGRLDEGRVKTTTNYAVRVDHLSIRFDGLSIGLAAEGGVTAFDPANPPPQYSLCHNGHCHHEDGRLVDYEDIALELAGGAGGGPVITQAFDEVPVALSSEPTPIDVGACSSDCQLPRGALATATLTIGSLELEGRVFDRLTGDAARVDEGGLPLSLSMPLTLNYGVALEGLVGKGEPVNVVLDGDFAVPSALFDGVEWAELVDGEGELDGADERLQSALRQNLEAGAAFTVQLSR